MRQYSENVLYIWMKVILQPYIDNMVMDFYEGHSCIYTEVSFWPIPLPTHYVTILILTLYTQGAEVSVISRRAPLMLEVIQCHRTYKKVEWLHIFTFSRYLQLAKRGIVLVFFIVPLICEGKKQIFSTFPYQLPLWQHIQLWRTIPCSRFYIYLFQVIQKPHCTKQLL